MPLAGELGNSGSGGTAASSKALKSATTTVDVSAATAPTSGQVLTATGGTAATWQTPSAVSAPFSDSTALVKNNSDATKLFKVLASGVTTGNTIVLTMSGTAAAPVFGVGAGGFVSFGGNSLAYSNGTGPVFNDLGTGDTWGLDLSGLSNNRTVIVPDASGVMTLLGNNKSGTGSIVLTSTPTITTPVLTTPTLNGMKTGVTAKTADYTLTTTDVTVTVDATAGNVTITLPAAAIGQLYRIKRIDASGNTVTVARAGSDTIDGATSVTLTTQWQAKTIQGLTQSPGGTWGVF